MGDLLPTPLKWRVFFSRQERNPAYLNAGDVITASIATEDDALDLGTQRTVVRDGSSDQSTVASGNTAGDWRLR
jgi:hypothetical protein